MAKQVPWNEEVYMTFCKLAMLSVDEREILRLRIMGYSITQTSIELGMSTSSVSRTISLLKKKYDNVQPLSQGVLPTRKTSVQETWMDNN